MTAKKPRKNWKEGLPKPTGRPVSDDEFMTNLAGSVRANFMLRGVSEADSIPYLVDAIDPDGRKYCVVTAAAAVMRNRRDGYGDFLDAGASLGWDADRSQRFSDAFDGVTENHDRRLREWMIHALASGSRHRP